MSKLIGIITDNGIKPEPYVRFSFNTGESVGVQDPEVAIAPEELTLEKGDRAWYLGRNEWVKIAEPPTEVNVGVFCGFYLADFPKKIWHCDMQNIAKFPLGSKVSYDLNPEGLAINVKIIEA